MPFDRKRLSLPQVSNPLASAQALSPRERAVLAELRRRRAMQEREDAASATDARIEIFKPYRYDPAAYIEKFLGWTPWEGEGDDRPGQIEILRAYTLALRQQHEKQAYEAGELLENQLQWWTPGQPIKNRIRVEAGHTVGKTKCVSGLTSHFFDCFPPAIIYTFAPTAEQIKRLLWKEIKADRDDAQARGKPLLGRVLDNCEIKYRPDHFAIGRATNDAGGRGTERVQGQHGKYLMFVLDEAEGVADYVYDAVDSMTSGGISIVLMTANPKTRLSKFYKQKKLSTVKNFRISCINHPNVVAGREIVPEAVQRSYVQGMIEKHCEPVAAHDAKASTFEVPFEAFKGEQRYSAGTIWKPNNEFCWRVLGFPPASAADNTLISLGRYEEACKREAPAEDHRFARMGVDVARWGHDNGNLYVRHAGRVRRAALFEKQDYIEYARGIVAEARRLKEAGVLSLHVRIDAGGGFGGGVISHLANGEEFAEFRSMFPDCLVLEVHFNGAAYDWQSYADLGTEMYAEADETLKRLRIEDPPELLEGDLTERTFDWKNKKGVSVKRLASKDIFKKEQHRSPDDGDGFVLAIAPDHIFEPRPEDIEQTVTYENRVHISSL